MNWLTLSAAPGRMCFSVGYRDWLDVISSTDRLKSIDFFSKRAMFEGNLQYGVVAFSVLGSSSSSSHRTIGFHRGLTVVAAGDDGAPKLRSFELSPCVIVAVHRCHSHVCQARDLAARQGLFLRVGAQDSAGHHLPSCPSVFGS